MTKAASIPDNEVGRAVVQGMLRRLPPAAMAKIRATGWFAIGLDNCWTFSRGKDGGIDVGIPGEELVAIVRDHAAATQA